MVYPFCVYFIVFCVRRNANDVVSPATLHLATHLPMSAKYANFREQQPPHHQPDDDNSMPADDEIANTDPNPEVDDEADGDNGRKGRW